MVLIKKQEWKLYTEPHVPYIKGVQKNQTVDIFLGNSYNFQYFTVIFHGDLGLEVGKYPVKFRNDISTQTREILT